MTHVSFRSYAKKINIMKKIIILLTLTLQTVINVYSQEKTEKGFWYDNKSVKSFKEDVSASKITTKCLDSSIITTKSITATLGTLAIKYAFKNVSKLFYNPEKFIKTHGTNLKLYNKTNILDFNTYKCIIYEKKNKQKNFMSLNFSLNDINFNGKSYKTINLDSFLYQYTNVKLKNKHHTINIVAEIVVTYFNNTGEVVALELDPFILSGYTPKGEDAITNTYTDISRILPTNNTITAIKIKVSEVNTRKKDWDKFLKLFNDNKEKAQTFIIDNYIKN